MLRKPVRRQLTLEIWEPAVILLCAPSRNSEPCYCQPRPFKHRRKAPGTSEATVEQDLGRRWVVLSRFRGAQTKIGCGLRSEQVCKSVNAGQRARKVSPGSTSKSVPHSGWMLSCHFEQGNLDRQSRTAGRLARRPCHQESSRRVLRL